MNFEQTEKDSQNSFELLQKEISQKIEQAKQHPLKVSRYLELESLIKAQQQKLFREGIKTQEDIDLDTKIQEEIIAAAAIVKTIPEYKELLTQVSQQYNLGEEWINDLLAHENAHANAAEQIGYEQVGYGTFFLADENGSLVSIQPAHVHIEPNSWTPIEVIENGIRTLEAPDVYQNKMSEDDVLERDNLLMEKQKLEERKEANEIQRQEDLSAVRNSLGI
jgi:hypothetical protein